MRCTRELALQLPSRVCFCFAAAVLLHVRVKAVRSCDHGACARMQELFAPTRMREVPSCKSGFKRCCKKLARQMPAGMVPTWHRLYVKLS